MYQQALIFSREQVISWEWDQGSGNHGNSLLWRKGERKSKDRILKAAGLVNWSTALLMIKSPLRKGTKTKGGN